MQAIQQLIECKIEAASVRASFDTSEGADNIFFGKTHTVVGCRRVGTNTLLP